MSHVLEHSLQPLDWLKHAWKLLSDDGILAIALPNFGGVYRFLGERDPWIIPPVHLQFFTPRSLRQARPRRLVLAIPVCAADTARRLEDSGLADAVVCAMASDHLVAVGAWYHDFAPTSDDEVIETLERARARSAAD